MGTASRQRDDVLWGMQGPRQPRSTDPAPRSEWRRTKFNSKRKCGLPAEPCKLTQKAMVGVGGELRTLKQKE